MTVFTCSCGKLLKIPPEATGKKVACPGCGKMMMVRAVGTASGSSSTESNSGNRTAAGKQATPRPSSASASTPSDPFTGNDPLTGHDPLAGINLGALPTPNSYGQPQSAWNASSYAPMASPRSSRSRGGADTGKVLLVVGAICLGFIGIAGVSIAAIMMGPSVQSVASTGASGSTSNVPQSTPTQAPSGPPITQQEAEQTVQRFLAAMSGRNVAMAGDMIDWREMARRAADGVDLSEKAKTDIVNGIMRSPFGRTILNQIVSEMDRGADYSLLRMREESGKPKAIIRFFSLNSGLNYHDLEFHRDATGKVVVSDLYIYSTGETLSETLRRGVVAAAATEGTFLEKLSGKQREAVKNFKAMQDFVNLKAAPQAALAQYRQLPQTVRDDKSIMLLRVRLAMQVNDSEYVNALEDLQRVHSNDAAMLLLAIDLYTSKKQFTEAANCVNALDQRVGGDPALDILRMGIYAEQGDLEKVRQLSESVKEKLPEFRKFLGGN